MTDVNIIRAQHIKESDQLPKLRAQLVESGDPFNLSDYSVEMYMQHSSEDISVTGTVSIESEDRGIITYNWKDGDTEEAGTYIAEFVATSGTTGESITFPNAGYKKIYVEEGIN